MNIIWSPMKGDSEIVRKVKQNFSEDEMIILLGNVVVTLQLRQASKSNRFNL